MYFTVLLSNLMIDNNTQSYGSSNPNYNYCPNKYGCSIYSSKVHFDHLLFFKYLSGKLLLPFLTK